jgi:vitamin B12 transporter
LHYPPRVKERNAVIASLALGAALSAAITPSPYPSPTPPTIAHVITSDRSEESAARAARTTYVVTKEEIVRNGYLTVADAIANLPGVSIERYGGFGSLSSVSIRGSSSTEVLILLDGMPVAGSQIDSIDLGQIPTNGIERIEVVEGGGSTLYGSGSMGGVINIITASPQRSRATLAAGSFGQQSLAIETPYLSLARSIAANDYALPNGDVQQNAYASLTSLRTGYAHTFGAWTFLLAGDAIDEHVGVPGAAGFYSATSREGTVDRDARFTLERSGAHSTVSVQLGASTSDLTFSCDTPVDPQCPNSYITPPSPYAQLLTEERTMADLSDVIDNGSERLVYGIDLSRGVARVDDGTDPLQIHPFDETAAYVQSQWFDARGDELYAGVRGERDGVSGGALSPSIGGIAPISGHLRLRWNAATAFRAPTEEELYYPFFSNPGLVPEKTRVGDVALEEDEAFGTLSAGWFTTDGRNLIADNPVTFVPENIGHAIVQGLTVEARSRTFGGYSGYVAVTNLYRVEDLDTGSRIAGRGPTFTVGSGVEYAAAPQSRFDGFGIELLAKGPRGIVNPALPAFDQPVAYARVDAYVGYRIVPRLVLVVRGFDLTNARYSEFGTYSPSSVSFYAYPVPGRSFAVELRTR